MRSVIFAILFLAALGWAAFVGYACLQAWPHMSLDLSHIDEGTRAAHGQAVTTHVVLHMLFGGVPLVIVSGLYWIFGRRG